MAQKLIRIRIRPVKVAVVLNSVAPLDAFLLAVRFLSAIWCGRFRAIVKSCG
jgi:hypothetical protein